VLHLSTFGGLWLARVGPDGTAGDQRLGPPRRKPLALLAVLAAYADAGVTRERLGELLWPELDAERGRRTLSQTLYALRRELGASPVRGSGALWLAPDVVRADLATFRDAVATSAAFAARPAGDPCAAADAIDAGARAAWDALAGPFAAPWLDGVHFPGAAAFDHWVDQWRARLEAERVRALADAARRLGRDGVAPDTARQLWDAVLLAAPGDDDLVADAMRAALDAGATARARLTLDAHVRHLRREIGADPGPAVGALAAALDLTPSHALTTPAAPAPAGVPRAPVGAAWVGAVPASAHPTGATPAVASAPTRAPAMTPGATRAADPPERRERRRLVPKRWQERLAAVYLLVSLVWFTRAGLGTRAQLFGALAGDGRDSAAAAARPPAPWADPAAGPVRVAVRPFRVVDLTGARGRRSGGDADAGADAGDRLARLLAHAVTDCLGIAAVTGTAEGADFVVTGDAVRADGRWRLSAELRPAAPPAGATQTAPGSTPGTAAVVRALPVAIVRAQADDADDGADSLALQLLAARAAALPGRVAAAAAGSVRSLGAYRAYLDGEHAYRQARYGESAAALRRAVALDPDFALAYYRLASAASYASDGAAQGAALAAARRGVARLPERERLLVEAGQAAERGHVRDAERRLRRVLELFPDDPEALFELGEVFFHTGARLGRSSGDAGPLFARVARLEPGNVEALAHWARTEARLGHLARVDSLAARVTALRGPGDRTGRELRLLGHLAGGRPAALAALADTVADEPDGETLLYLVAWRAAAYTDSLRLAEPVARRLGAETADPRVRLRARLRHAEYAMADGRLAEALARAASPPDGDAALLGARAYFAALPFSGASAAVRRAYADSLARWTRPLPPLDDYPRDELALDGADPRLRDYPLGLLAVRLGDLAGADRAAAALERVAGSADLRRAAHGLAAVVRAERAAAAGDVAGALGHLAAADPDVPQAWRLTLHGGGALARYLRAEWRLRAGAAGPALAEFRTFGSDNAGELAFAGAVRAGRQRASATTGALASGASPRTPYLRW
jgi:DNA-binding SARP family transcriptional activator